MKDHRPCFLFIAASPACYERYGGYTSLLGIHQTMDVAEDHGKHRQRAHIQKVSTCQVLAAEILCQWRLTLTQRELVTSRHTSLWTRWATQTATLCKEYWYSFLIAGKMPPSVVPPPRRPDETFLLMASVGPTLWVMNVGMLAPLGIGHVSSCSFGLLPLLRWALYGKMPLTVVPPPWRPTKTVRKSACLHLIGHTSLKPARCPLGYYGEVCLLLKTLRKNTWRVFMIYYQTSKHILKRYLTLKTTHFMPPKLRWPSAKLFTASCLSSSFKRLIPRLWSRFLVIYDFMCSFLCSDMMLKKKNMCSTVQVVCSELMAG